MTSQPSDLASAEGLVVDGISHAYGRFIAVREVDLCARPGEVHCLLGPSGSGKSTILRLIAGLETLRRGSIRIAGREIAGPAGCLGPEHRSVGLVFQDYALFPHLDVLRNVQFGMPRGARKPRRELAEALLERVGMNGHARAMPHTLSGGQQQRVALARALAREPAVMLLDEPFSGLDARLRRDVRNRTLDVLRAAKVATLMVTHDPREALLAGDVITVLHEGRRLQTGSPAELYSRATSSRVAEVFGPINRLTGRVVQGRVETACGDVVAAGLDDGVAAEVLVRPEGLSLTAAAEDAATTATIDRVALEGATVLVEVVLADGQRLITRHLAPDTWSVGERVTVSIATHAAQVVPVQR